ncbi:MAG: chorismate mutase, partial [Elusimicrobia bacterium]|nr:chorismate mutase [Elusimicrobiota bacterium]
MKEVRKKIDNLDRKISKLLDERALLVRKIGDLKKNENTEVFVPSREREVINNILSVSSAEGYPPESKISIFSEIFAASRA